MNLISRIFDKTQPDRDLIVDELGDRLVSGGVSEKDRPEIIRSLLTLVLEEADFTVLESLCNLLASEYDANIIRDEILQTMVEALPKFHPGCLVHAIPIIARSSLDNKKELLSPFLASTNVAVRAAAEDIRQYL